MDVVVTILKALGVVAGSLGLWALLAWGFKATVDAIGKGLQAWLQKELDKQLSEHRHELEKRLEDYKLGPASLLALFTHRSGLLSEVQLKAAQETWATLCAAQAGLDALVSPYKTVAVESHPIDAFDVAKEALRVQEQAQTHQLLKDNADLFAIVQRHKPFLPKTLFEKVSAYTDKLLQVEAFLEERRAFVETLPSVPLKDRPAAAERARGYGKARDEHITQLRNLAENVEEEIRRLTTPSLQEATS